MLRLYRAEPVQIFVAQTSCVLFRMYVYVNESEMEKAKQTDIITKCKALAMFNEIVCTSSYIAAYDF